MKLSQRPTFQIVIDLVHDLTAGMLPGAVLALWLVRRGAEASLGSDAASTLAQSWTWIVAFIFVTLVIFVVSGSIRLSYHAQAHGRVALIKHSAFILVWVGATIVAFTVIQP